MPVEGARRPPVRETDAPAAITATVVIDGVPYVVALTRQERGYYGEVTVNEIGQAESPHGTGGSQSCKASDPPRTDPCVYLG